MGRASEQAAARTVRLYPWFAAIQSVYAWMPIFFLYLSSRVTLAEVLWLEAAYYITVVVTEVPSGYASDRFGRKPTLLIATSALVAAYVTFALGESFGALLAAEMLLAVGLAFQSGTDTSLHLDALESLGRGDEYADREARVSFVSLMAMGVGSVAGGLLGAVDLRLPYVLSGVLALAASAMVLSFTEPPRDESGGDTDRFLPQLRRCGAAATSRPLVWFFLVSVVATVVNHMPYEFYQPWLDALAAERGGEWGEGPVLSGLHAAITMAVAAVFGARAAALARRLGARAALLASVALQVVLVTGMALFLHIGVAVLLLLRSVPRAIQAPVLNAEVAPRVGKGMRATYLSLQSLVGRLAYGTFLLGLGAGALDLDTVLAVATATGAALLVALLVLSPLGRPREDRPA